MMNPNSKQAHAGYRSQGVIYDLDNLPVDATTQKWRLNSVGNHVLNWAGVPFTSPSILDAAIGFMKSVVATQAPVSAFNTFHAIQTLDRSPAFVDADESDDVIPLVAFTELLLADANDTWRTHYVRQFYNWAADWGYPNFSAEVAFEANQMRIGGNEKGRAVLSADPEAGPLTDLEITGLLNALKAAEDSGSLNPDEAAALWLSIALGPNSVQMSTLREEDLKIFKDDGGKPAFFHMDVPRMKKAGLGLRAGFRRRPLNTQIAASVLRLIHHNARMRKSSKHVREKIRPMFPRPAVRHSIEDGPMADYATHMTPPEFTRLIASAVDKLSVISHRTGRPLKVTTRRLRYTFATRLVREGVSKREVADLLDHSDLQNVQVYFDIKSDIVDNLDKAMAMTLGPLAQAFMGKVVQGSDQATRGTDPTSKVATIDKERNAIREVGSCGSFSFCRLMAPIACYTCKDFQPWMDAPHHLLLDDLLKDRERKQKAGMDARMVSIADSTILAIADVINRIEEATREAGK
ncbi:site-specific integrase [Devosia sp. 1566]|uniref:site-specific integrase n=1 Tax=Devosia sp. 1566 TaxID=2499144 RepID=UPI000FD8F474|nr:site-specific integrase [Devosia sp. 1566]